MRLLFALFLAGAGLLGAMLSVQPSAAAQQPPVEATAFGGSIVDFTPGGFVPNPNATVGTACPPPEPRRNDDPTAALGPPDADHSGSIPADEKSVSLGFQGSITIEFDGRGAGDGDHNTPDVWVWEVGSHAEPYSVYVSEDGSNFVHVGDSDLSTFGPQGFDVDHAGFNEFSQIRYIRVVDTAPNRNRPQPCYGPSGDLLINGSDIDAVAVLSPALEPTLEIVKTNDVVDEAELAVDDVVEYTFTVTNTGNVDLYGVTVTDELDGISATTPASVDLPQGESAEFTATYVVTQADIDAGQIHNTATATGDPDPRCTFCETPVSPPGENTITPPQEPDLEITKVADTEGPVERGETITYTFTVENTGNVTLTDVTVADQLEGLSDTDPLSVATLAPGASAEFTATYVVTEADILSGSVHNEATSTGNPPPSYDGPPPISPPDDVTVPGVDPNPAMTLTKEADTAGPVELGETITYTFTATNTGNVTLSNVSVSDPLPGLSDITPDTVATLVPGASAEFSATYVVTEADILAGGVDNVATGTGTPPEGCEDCAPPEPESPPVHVPAVEPEPGLTLTKEPDTAGPVGLGETITYTFTATNTGNVTLDPVVITDELPGLTWLAGPNLGALGPGESATGTATYVVTEADILAGGDIVNTATGEGTPPEGCEDCTPPTSEPPPVEVPVEDPFTGLTVLKTADTDGPLVVGEVVTYTITATNTGNVTLTDVMITDELPGISDIEPASATLAPGESVDFAATYEVQQTDIDTGHVTNSATGTGQPPADCETCETPTSPPSVVRIPPEDPFAELQLVKEADTEGPVAPGETITYTFTVTNTGNTTVFNVTIDDPMDGLRWTTGPELGTLAPGRSATGTATYVVTEADILEGGVANSAFATGDPSPVCEDCDPTSPPDDVTVPGVDPNPAMTLTKEADTAGPVELGETITYTFTVTNTGNVTLSNVSVSDPLPGLSDITPDTVATLVPGASAEFSATYVVTEADILAGGVDNVATGTGTPPEGCEDCAPPEPESPPVHVPGEDPNPALEIIKEAEPAGPVEAGDTITYTFTVENTGNVTLTDVAVSDPLPGLSEITPASVDSLAPGESAEFSATYEVTQADVDAGGIDNVATTTGTPPEGCEDCTPPEPESPPVHVPTGDPSPGLVLTKAANTAGPAGLGETITYTFTVENTGNVTLNPVIITDELPGLIWVTGPNLGALAPGETAQGSATYVVTEADILAGGDIVNTATGEGTPPEGCEDCTPPTSEPPPVEIPTENPNPAMTLGKVADTEGPVAVGDTITYTFTATNTGNVTLTDVAVSDPLPGLSPITPESVDSLAPGASAEFSATYEVTEADILAGGIDNIATGTGTPPEDCTDCTSPEPESPPVYVPGVEPAPGLTLTKAANTAGPVAAGDTITYTFTATNSGNVTLDPVVITDDLPGLTWLAGPNLGALAPGEDATGTATYTVTEADVLAGGVTNVATGTGTPPEGCTDCTPPTSEPPPVEIPADEPVTGLAIVKTADTDGPVGLGEEITYTFVATNTGNVTLTDVAITDQLPGIAWVTGPNLGALAPGESATGMATYVTTEADILAGRVVNSATVSGTPPGELPPPTSPPSTVTVPTTEPDEGLVLVKNADAEGPVAVGDTITYTFTVTNTGTVTLTGISVADALPGLSDIKPTAVEALAPGESTTFTATYVVTQGDVNAGGIANSATASGTPPSGERITTPPSTVNVPTQTGTMGLALAKTVSPDTTVEEGDQVTYTFVVTNIGNTTASDVTVSDPLPGLSDIEGPHGISLEPGETATFTATYVVTEADTILGILSNTALATGNGPDGEELSALDTARVRACVDPQPVTPTPEPTEPVGTPDATPTEAVEEPTATPGTDPVETVEPTSVPTEEPTAEPTDVPTEVPTAPIETEEPVEPAPGEGNDEGEPDPEEPEAQDDGIDPNSGDSGDADDIDVQGFLGTRTDTGRLLLQETGDEDLADCVPLDPDPVLPDPTQPAPAPAPPVQPAPPAPQPSAPGGGSPVKVLPTTGQTGPAMSQTTLLVGGLTLLAVTAIGLGLVSRGTIRFRKR